MQHNRPDYHHRIQDSAGIIPADEPVFLLRGQDKVAAAAVRFWAFMAKDEGADSETTAAALRQADAMDAWPVKKLPDNPHIPNAVPIMPIPITDTASLNRVLQAAERVLLQPDDFNLKVLQREVDRAWEARL